ncbi:hypothetical protein, partial [Halomonas sp. ND22Bw]|uniref:hypothetical protein n=1 Tax=Halomonas sp. ND22Bw TaxID=2054178 RepID=UPI001C63523E
NAIDVYRSCIRCDTNGTFIDAHEMGLPAKIVGSQIGRPFSICPVSPPRPTMKQAVSLSRPSRYAVLSQP